MIMVTSGAPSEMPILVKAYAWTQKKIAYSTLSSVILFFASLCVNYLAGTYALREAGNSVSDLILDHVRVMDVDGIYTSGMIGFSALVMGLLVRQPRRAPFVLKSLSLFVVVRSFFVILTHIGPSPQTSAILLPELMNKFTFGADLFFSGHTGIPFLLALIYWKNFPLRLIFFVTSIVFGVIVLLGHFHYSIDVFSAFFITYGIYHIALEIFEKEYHLFLSQDKKSPRSA